MKTNLKNNTVTNIVNNKIIMEKEDIIMIIMCYHFREISKKKRNKIFINNQIVRSTTTNCTFNFDQISFMHYFKLIKLLLLLRSRSTETKFKEILKKFSREFSLFFFFRKVFERWMDSKEENEKEVGEHHTSELQNHSSEDEEEEKRTPEVSDPNPKKKKRKRVKRYFRRFMGQSFLWGKGGPPPMSSFLHFIMAAIGSFSFIGILSALRYSSDDLEDSDYTIILGSYGASAVVCFAAPNSPLSQPRNIFFGHLLAVIVGILCRDYIAEPMDTKGFALPFAVCVALFLMMATRTVHPPAGGTVAIAVLSSESIDRLGWGLLVPVTYSSIICVIVCLFVNNVHSKYPQYWLVGEKNHRYCL